MNISITDIQAIGTIKEVSKVIFTEPSILFSFIVILIIAFLFSIYLIAPLFGVKKKNMKLFGIQIVTLFIIILLYFGLIASGVLPEILT